MTNGVGLTITDCKKPGETKLAYPKNDMHVAYLAFLKFHTGSDSNAMSKTAFASAIADILGRDSKDGLVKGLWGTSTSRRDNGVQVECHMIAPLSQIESKLKAIGQWHSQQYIPDSMQQGDVSVDEASLGTPFI